MPAFRLSSKLLVGALAAASALAAPATADAFSPFLVVPEPAVAEASPAYRYANMTDAQALAELDRRGIPYARLDDVPGVRAPVRLAGRLHGVYVHSSLPLEQRLTSVFEILDARLALALDDFCALLERHDVDEVVHFTMYRPNVTAPGHGVPDEAPEAAGKPGGARPRPIAGATKAGAITPRLKGALEGGAKPAAGAAPAPVGKTAPAKAAPPATKAAPATTKTAPSGGPLAPAVKRVAKRDALATGLHPTTWAPPGTRHPAGLAIDVGMLHKRDGRWLSVGRDFHGKIGARTCGEGAPAPENPTAIELRALVCESADQGVFTYVLTPDYNAAHADHFHMEIKPGVKWFLYH